jgi:tubulin monoglycylase TTLL3/8
MNAPELTGIPEKHAKTSKTRASQISLHSKNVAVLEAITTARKAKQALKNRTLERRIDDSETRPEMATGGPTRRATTDAFSEWKRKNKVPTDSNVFIIKGGYLDLKRGLEKRGWTENKDGNSEFFDLKWTLNAKDIDYDKLNDKQMVNHFVKNREITTKIGLTKNLKYECSDQESFFPRSFDLSDYNERLEFVSAFKLNKAVSILKIFQKHFAQSAERTYSVKVVSTAISVVNRSLVDVDDALDIPSLAESIGKTHDAEWKTLRFVSLSSFDELTDDGEGLPGAADRGNRSPSKRASIPPKLVPGEFSASLAEYDHTSLLDGVKALLESLERKDPQFKLNGTRNMWIVKPAGKSRGRGIELKRNLLEIAHTLSSGVEGELLVVQKYIENPQIIEGYKFDIRQWVLVTDWNPLTIYIWQQPYIRFASEKFDADYKSSSAYVHLVNNSVNKSNPTFSAMNEALNTDDYMWFRQDYEKWHHQRFCPEHNTPFLTSPPYTSETMKFDLDAALKGEYGVDFTRPRVTACGSCCDVWTKKIAPQIKDIVLQSLWSVMDSIEHRKGSCELYGYDFMVSDDNKVWLIEVNSSPAMDYSTHVTAPLIKIVLDDTAAILNDSNAVNTGEWELAHKVPSVQRHLHGQNQRLQVDGVGVKRPSSQSSTVNTLNIGAKQLHVKRTKKPN